MRARLSLPLALVFAFGPACSSEQTEECREYVECAQAVDALTFNDTEAVWSEYDEGGSCWGDALSSQACNAGCVGALQVAQQQVTPLPVECGGDFVLPPRTVSKTVGVEGGVIEVLGLTLDIPAGALGEPVELVVETTREPAPDGAAFTTVFSFSPEGLEFAAPVSARFLLPPAARGQPASVYWSVLGAPSVYEELGGDVSDDEIVATTTHFSTCYVAPPGGGGGEIDAGPAPDAGPALDAGPVEPDAGVTPDGGPGADDAGPGDDDDAGPGGDDDAGAGGDDDAGPGDDDAGPQLAPPVATFLSLTEVRQGSHDLPLAINFSDAAPASPDTVIHADDVPLETLCVAAVSCHALVPASLLATVGTVAITAHHPTEGASNALSLEVVAGGNAAPTLSSVSPPAVAQGSASTLVIVLGSGIQAGAQVWYGLRRAGSSYANEGQINFTLYPNDLLTAADAPVRVVNGGPGGGASQPRAFAISGDNPVPNLSSITPAELGTGTALFHVTLTGEGFLPSGWMEATAGDVVTPLFWRRISDTSGTVGLPAELLVSPGAIELRLSNPAPGGGAGTPASVLVVAGNPTPLLTNVSPYQLRHQQSGQQLTLFGSGFGAFSSVEEVDSLTTLPVVSASATQLVVDVPDGLVASPGGFSVRVLNEGPGGGASAARYLAVTAPPQLTSLDPATVTAGGPAFALTLYGEQLGQEGYRYVTVGGTYVEPSALEESYWVVTVPSTLIEVPGTLDVIAHIEGVGSSQPLPLEVTAQ